MPIRVRLALWYSALTSLVIVIVVVAAYVTHNRGSYEDIDRHLVTTANHFREVFLAGEVEPGIQADPDGSVLVRVYRRDQAGVVPPAEPRAPISPLQTLLADDGPTYDPILRWLPGGVSFAEGAFATATDPTAGGRVRLYAIPAGDPGRPVGYVQAWTSLQSLDDSMQRFRLLLLALGAGGVASVLVCSLLIAGRALRPVATMTQTAHTIAASRGFSRRVPEPQRQDELGQLARTFNEMLGSLEEAYRAQQRFVADASHELRAPLTAIQGNIELLARFPEMPADEREEALTYLESESRRLSRMVGELLTLARADAGQTLERRTVELDAVLLEAVTEMRRLSAHHRVAVDDVEPISVEGDRDRLKQLVLILLDNALKYTPEAGQVRISLGRSGGLATLAVRDDGIGIPAEALPHVFERFYRADPARGRDPGGTGLGLSIARWIVEQHGGEISIQSTVGSGTTVTASLPFTEGWRPASTAPARDAARL